MSVSAVVVTYNRLKLLKECINNLLTQSYKLDYIFVINNNSQDGTKKYLNHIKNSRIIPINICRNLGGAGGFSLGTQIAFKRSDSDYFWLMDDDTMPKYNALNSLMKSAKQLKGHFGFLCSNVRWWKNNEPSYMNVPDTSNDWNYRLNDGLIKLIFASFVSLLVPRWIVKKLGLPIADMFIWGDDVEYTTRISKKYNSYLVANSIVIHKSVTNSVQNSIVNAPLKRLIYYKCMFRNRLYVSRRYYKFRKTIKLLIIYSSFLVDIILHSKDHKIKRMLFTFMGIINGLLFNPKIRYPR